MVISNKKCVFGCEFSTAGTSINTDSSANGNALYYLFGIEGEGCMLLKVVSGLELSRSFYDQINGVYETAIS